MVWFFKVLSRIKTTKRKDPKCLSADPDPGRASVPRAITACNLLYAEESNAIGGCADFLMREGEGKLVLAWLARTLVAPAKAQRDGNK